LKDIIEGMIDKEMLSTVPLRPSPFEAGISNDAALTHIIRI